MKEKTKVSSYPEIEALETVVHAMIPLDLYARARIFAWISDWIVSEGKKEREPEVEDE